MAGAPGVSTPLIYTKQLKQGFNFSQCPLEVHWNLHQPTLLFLILCWRIYVYKDFFKSTESLVHREWIWKNSIIHQLWPHQTFLLLLYQQTSVVMMSLEKSHSNNVSLMITFNYHHIVDINNIIEMTSLHQNVSYGKSFLSQIATRY